MRGKKRAEPSSHAPRGDEGYAVGYHPVRTILERHPERVERLLLARDADAARAKHLIALAHDRRIPFQQVPGEAIARIAGELNHQGIAAKVSPVEMVPAEELIAALTGAPLVVVLDGVEDPRNLGAVLRSAAGFGVGGLFIPDRRAAGLTPAAVRTAAGGAEIVPVGRTHNIGQLLDKLLEAEFRLVALDPAAEAPIWEVDLRGRVALVAGGEEKGVRPTVMRRCQQRASIPIAASIGSLNVSVAVGIVLAEATRQRNG